MGKHGKNKLGQCAYCGNVGEITVDDIPPKNLFAKPRPHNLVKVPSCVRCNGGASKDDEYFRLWMTMREQSKGNPDREGVLAATIRSLERPVAKGFQTDFARSNFIAPRFSPSGIYIGSHPAFAASGQRLDAVAIRIVKGLFYHHRRKRLPSDYCVRAVHLSRLGELERASRLVMEEFIEALLESPVHRVGHAFGYWTLQSPNGWARSIWLLEFYGNLDYFCTTQPLELPEVLPVPA
jgi:hypothetical protein